MLVPASRLKTDWQRSKASKKEKNRQYKPRDPIGLPDKAVAAFKDLVQATSVDAVELALQDLKIYDVKEKHFTNWRAAAKTFDDWRLVCFGPQASAYWQVHSAGLPPPAGRNLHMGCLCWFCHVSSRWGPCEHMYCCAEHEGKINAGVLPEAKRSGRPPKRFAKAAPSEHAPPTVVTPGPMMQRESSAGSCGPSIPAQAPLPTEDTLHKLLRKVVLGQYVQEFQRQGATLAAVTALSVDGLRTFFGFDLGQAHALKTAIDAFPTASASSAPSSAVSPHAPSKKASYRRLAEILLAQLRSSAERLVDRCRRVAEAPQEAGYPCSNMLRLPPILRLSCAVWQPLLKCRGSHALSTELCEIDWKFEELHESMKAQLREKTEKEELYRSRIEYLQQQIEVYNQYAARATVRLSSPRMAPASPRDARARSLRLSGALRFGEVTSSAVAEGQAQVGDRLRLAAVPHISISCLAAPAKAARRKVAATIAAGDRYNVDEAAQRKLGLLPPEQAESLLRNLETGNIRNPSAFIMKAVQQRLSSDKVTPPGGSGSRKPPFTGPGGPIRGVWEAGRLQELRALLVKFQVTLPVAITPPIERCPADNPDRAMPEMHRLALAPANDLEHVGSVFPSCEPRTPDADVTGLSTTRTAASFIGVRSGTAIIRSLSAQEVRTNEPARQFSPEREAASPRVPGSPTPIVCVSREPVVLTSPPGSCTAPTPAKRASPQREPTISPRPLVPTNVIPRLESLRSVSIPATTMYSVSAVRSVQPLYVPAGPQYVVLPQGRAKEPLAVIPGNSNNVPLRNERLLQSNSKREFSKAHQLRADAGSRGPAFQAAQEFQRPLSFDCGR
ncbi:hypothetical protein AK812_SmicGene3025 [Symbiodinium microadriaticum]|uniref:SAM domain-containing protein n=1 Tax=Symbiodinium microadriaticum TaxID=2951 RepID=A0A1Q9F048_SYMMI|nr:hypothetical protein AK812_SmicGene3025 [Symbiodinium microadriaticum]